MVLDPAHQVLAHGQPVELSNREYDLLHALMLNAGRVLSREQLEQRLYEWGSEINSNAWKCISTTCAASWAPD